MVSMFYMISFAMQIIILQSPNPHPYDYDFFFPDNDVTAAGNACRNPDGCDKPWCYHANEGRDAWDYCNVPFCPGKFTPYIQGYTNT